MAEDQVTIEVMKAGKMGEKFALLEGGQELGYMSFKRVHEEGIIVEHTLVHPQGQGRGLAGRLFAHVMEWATERDLYVVPVCPYVYGRLEKYPEKGDRRAVARGPLEG